MANLEKYTEQAGFAMMRHNAREGKKHSNKNINAERTHENYTFDENGKTNIIESTRETKAQYLKRKKSVYCYSRSDIKTMCQWCIQVPEDLNPADEEKFFGAATIFLGERYGIENCLQFIVHKDESTPHLHFVFSPITKDKKHGGEKICAAEVIDRNELMAFHDELQEFLGRYGIYNRIVHEKTNKDA